MSFAEVAELIDILFGIWTRVGPSKHVVDGGYTLAPAGKYDLLHPCVAA